MVLVRLFLECLCNKSPKLEWIQVLLMSAIMIWTVQRQMPSCYFAYVHPLSKRLEKKDKPLGLPCFSSFTASCAMGSQAPNTVSVCLGAALEQECHCLCLSWSPNISYHCSALHRPCALQRLLNCSQTCFLCHLHYWLLTARISVAKKCSGFALRLEFSVLVLKLCL